jgi:DNA-binding transcriptional LysR family regulator
VVFDGIVSVSAILGAIKAMTDIPTQVEVYADFLDGVEQSFDGHDADLMISVLPPTKVLERAKLPDLVAHLVARRDHPLAKKKRVTESDLRGYPLLTVRGSDPRLALATSRLEGHASMHLNDFHTKREAILAGIGYGWLPEYLDSPRLARVRFARGSRHVFQPHVYWRAERLGRAAKMIIDTLV